MLESHYVLGLDIGDDTVAAAVCRRDGEFWSDPAPLWLGDGRPLGRAAVEVAADGTVRPLDPHVAPGAGTAKHVMARVGAAAPLVVDGRGIDAADVVAALVAHVRSVAEAQEGAAPARTLLVVPPSWGPHRRSSLIEAVRSVCPDAGLVSSAVAATQHHASTGELSPTGAVAVYDLGASFLDTAIVGPAADGTLHHLAPPPPPLAWGGRDVDDALVGHLLRCLELPPDGGTQAAVPAAVDGLRERAVAAKEALTVDTVVCVDLPLPTGPVRVTREELDELIDQRVEESVALMVATLAGAGLAAQDLDGVVLAGGAARMPLAAERLSAELGVPVVVDPEPELAAARGAARLAAADLLATRPDADARAMPGTSRGREAWGVAASAGERTALEDQPGESLEGSPVRRGAPGRRNARLLPRTREGAAARGLAGASRPGRSPAGRPPGSPRVPTGPQGDRRAIRALLVTAMFVGLVALMSSLVSVISDVRTAPTAQGQDPTAPDSPAAVAPPGDDGVPPGTAAGTGDSLAEAGSHRAAADRTPATGQGGTRTSAAPVAPGTTAPVAPGTTAPVAPSPVDVSQPATVPPTTPLTTPPPTTEPPTTPTTAPPTTVPGPTTETPDTTSTAPPSDSPPDSPPTSEPPVEPTQDAGTGTVADPADGTPTDGTTP